MKTQLAALAALILLASPLATLAQEVPSYAAPANGDDQQIRGRIANFDGGYNLQVRDDQGYVDNVQLHDGTIINPTGLTLAPGMVVSIIGYNSGSFFGANEIDTPYNYYGGVPYYSGHPWNYYDSGFTLGFFFGNTGWWHGNDFGGAYSYNRGIRVYANANFRNVYSGGSFQGRNYVARGGYAQGRNTYNRTTVVNHNYTNVTTTRNTNYNGNEGGRTYAAPHTYTAPRTEGGSAFTQTHANYQRSVQPNAGAAQRFNAPRGGAPVGGNVRSVGGGHPAGNAGAAHAGGGGAPHSGGGGGGGDHHH